MGAASRRRARRFDDPDIYNAECERLRREIDRVHYDASELPVEGWFDSRADHTVQKVRLEILEKVSEMLYTSEVKIVLPDNRRDPLRTEGTCATRDDSIRREQEQAYWKMVASYEAARSKQPIKSWRIATTACSLLKQQLDLLDKIISSSVSVNIVIEPYREGKASGDTAR